MQTDVELVLFCCQYVTHHSVHIYGINTLVLVEIWVGLVCIAVVPMTLFDFNTFLQLFCLQIGTWRRMMVVS